MLSGVGEVEAEQLGLAARGGEAGGRSTRTRSPPRDGDVLEVGVLADLRLLRAGVDGSSAQAWSETTVSCAPSRRRFRRSPRRWRRPGGPARRRPARVGSGHQHQVLGGGVSARCRVSITVTRPFGFGVGRDGHHGRLGGFPGVAETRSSGIPAVPTRAVVHADGLQDACRRVHGRRRGPGGRPSLCRPRRRLSGVKRQSSSRPVRARSPPPCRRSAAGAEAVRDADAAAVGVALGGLAGQRDLVRR